MAPKRPKIANVQVKFHICNGIYWNNCIYGIKIANMQSKLQICVLTSVTHFAMLASEAEASRPKRREVTEVKRLPTLGLRPVLTRFAQQLNSRTVRDTPPAKHAKNGPPFGGGQACQGGTTWPVATRRGRGTAAGVRCRVVDSLRYAFSREAIRGSPLVTPREAPRTSFRFDWKDGDTHGEYV
jgi:hypothetical protein